MRTAIYARISTVTHSQQHSIEEQISRLRACLLARGEAVADEHIFRDEGRSGATLNRPALDRLRDSVRLGDYDGILVTSPDRLARNYVHQCSCWRNSSAPAAQSSSLISRSATPRTIISYSRFAVRSPNTSTH